MNTPVEHGKLYRTGLLASTDLHAGGILFGYVYREILLFESDQTVVQSFEIIDTFVQMENESETLSNQRNTGLYKLNSRGLLELDFQNKRYTGIRCKNIEPDTLAFNVYFKQLSIQPSSKVFSLEEQI